MRRQRYRLRGGDALAESGSDRRPSRAVFHAAGIYPFDPPVLALAAVFVLLLPPAASLLPGWRDRVDRGDAGPVGEVRLLRRTARIKRPPVSGGPR